MTRLLDIIRADNARYREALDAWCRLVDVTLEGPPKESADEGRERVATATEPAADRPGQ